jgi:hypothetical protein
MKTRGKRLFLGAAALVAALTVIPATGWLVRAQLAMVSGGSMPGLAPLIGTFGSSGADAAPERPVSVGPADDYRLHLAAAVETAPPTLTYGAGRPRPAIIDRRTLALTQLRDRFDDQPGLHAHILRYLSLGDLKVGRDIEQDLISRSPSAAPPAAPPGPPAKSSPEALALAEEAAARGEALDTDNAYFPQMLAIALLSQERDDEAVAALRRAASKRRWYDYSPEEVEGRFALAERRYGEPGALGRTAIAASLLFPHYAQLRASARVFATLAMRREVAGDTEAGFAIRHDLARIGALMRYESRYVVGSLVGVAITSIAAARPDGAPVLSGDDYPNAMRSSANEARYIAYLSRIGHTEEAAWFVAERRAAEKMRAVEQAAMGSSLWGMMPFVWLVAWWGAGILLLQNTVWTLALGGIAYLLCRAGCIRAGLPAHRGVRCGLAMLFMAPLAGAVVEYTGSAESLGGSDGVAISVFGILALMLGTPAAYLKRGQTWREFGRNLGVCAATLTAFAAVLALVALSLSGGRQLLSPLGLINGLSSGSEDDSVAKTMIGAVMPIAGAALTGPGMLMLVLAVRSWRRRVPVSVGLVRGMRSAAVPVAGVLLLLYAAALGGTLVQERNVRAALEQTMKHEGKYLSGLVGQEWPAPVDDAPAHDRAEP